MLKIAEFCPGFMKCQQNLVRRGDYWLIPARHVTGDVEWPKVTDENGNVKLDDERKPIPKFLPAKGIVHQYAPIAMINVAGEKISRSHDCRCSFEPKSSECANNKSGRLGIGTDLTCPPDNSNDEQ